MSFDQVIRSFFQPESLEKDGENTLELYFNQVEEHGQQFRKLSPSSKRDFNACGNTARLIIVLAKLRFNFSICKEFTDIDEFQDFVLSTPQGAFFITLSGHALENQGHVFTLIKLGTEYSVYQSYINRYNVLDFMNVRNPNYRGVDVLQVLQKVRVVSRSLYNLQWEQAWKELACFTDNEMYPLDERSGHIQFKATAFL